MGIGGGEDHDLIDDRWQIPDWWNEFCSWPTPWVCWGSWETGTIKVGPCKGETWHAWIGGESCVRLVEELTLGDIEECCSEDPDHDWRLTVLGPMYGGVWQRHGDKLWHPIERLEGFA